MSLTKLDISYLVSTLSQFLQCPTVNHWESCKRVLRYLKGTLYHGLQLQANNQVQVQGFADYDWAGIIDDRRLVSGYYVYFVSNLISWSSKKQQVVAQLSTEVEYRALAHITSEIC